MSELLCKVSIELAISLTKTVAEGICSPRHDIAVARRVWTSRHLPLDSPKRLVWLIIYEIFEVDGSEVYFFVDVETGEVSCRSLSM